MVEYVKVTNGSTARLINAHNDVLLNEALDDGFYIELDENHLPVIVKSTDLNKSDKEDKMSVLDKLKAKAAQKNGATQNPKPLGSRSIK